LLQSQRKPTCVSLMRGYKICAWPIIAVSVLLAVLAVYYTVTNLRVSTNRGDLVGSSQNLVQLSDKMDKAFGGRDGMVVVVESPKKEAAIKFADALAAELRRYPDNFKDLFYHVNPDSFKPWALLFLDSKDLSKLKTNIYSQKHLLARLSQDPRLATFYGQVNDQMAQTMVGHLFTGFLDEKTEKELPDVTLLNASLRELHRSLEGKSYTSPFNAFFPRELSDISEEGYFFTDNDKFLMFLVTPQPDGFTTISQNLSLLRDVVYRVKTQFPGIKAGVTGPDALTSDEMSSSMKDVALATWLSLAGQMLLLILFLRSFKRTLIEGFVLIIGMCWTFGLVTLVVGHLNLLSLVFAPLMLGLTIDYGIHWFARLEEEQQGQPCSTETLGRTFRLSLPGITYAGLAAAASFLPLALVSFKGLAELGLILTMGIIVMLAVTLILVPALVMTFEHCRPAEAEPADAGAHPRPFLHLHWKRPKVLVILGLAVTLLGVFSWRHVAFDLNPLHLQNPHTESVVWENKLIEDSKYSTSYGALATASLQELEYRIQALKKLDTVSHVESVLSFLPADVEQKRPILEEMRPILSMVTFPLTGADPADPQELAGILSRINFKMDEAAKNLEKDKAATGEQIAETHLLINKIIPLLKDKAKAATAMRLAGFQRQFFADLHGKWELFQDYARSALESPTMTVANLPQPVRDRFISPDGTYLIRVFPSQDIWNFGPLKLFVKSLWSIDPNAVGDPVLLYVFTMGFRNSVLWASGLAVLAITFLLIFVFQSVRMALLALIPLLVGTGLTLNLMLLLGLPFNQANVLFLPLILGEGIEFGIIILTRWKLEVSTRAITLPASTAKGVALAALTTTVGFGSLMVSGHRGTFSLGLLATVGSLSVLLTSLSILPAFLRLMERGLSRQPAFCPYLGLGRWLHHMIRSKSHEKAVLDNISGRSDGRLDG
jgi:uncharacterized protein